MPNTCELVVCYLIHAVDGYGGYGGGADKSRDRLNERNQFAEELAESPAPPDYGYQSERHTEYAEKYVRHKQIY